MSLLEPIFGVDGDFCGPQTSVGPLGIIALPGTQEIAEKINRYLVEWRNKPENGNGLLMAHPGYARDTFIIDASLPRFGNGEGKGIIRETVRGYDIYILCDIGNYGETYSMFGMKYPMSPDDHFQNLKRIIAAMGGKAKRVTVVMPMLYEARQHRRMARESLDCAIALQELVAMGVDNLIAFDAHDPRVQNAIPLHGFENIMPTYQMLKALIRHEPELSIQPDRMMIVAPDEGGMGRNIYYATFMGLDLGMFYKRRDYTRIINGRNPIIAHEYIGADVSGKDILIADDILSSGDSMLDLATELKKRNARNIYMFITYALFTDGLDAFNKAHREGIITRVFSTNLTYRTPELKAAPWFREADLSKYIAYVIATLNHDRSVSALLDPAARVAALLRRKRETEV